MFPSLGSLSSVDESCLFLDSAIFEAIKGIVYVYKQEYNLIPDDDTFITQG